MENESYMITRDINCVTGKLTWNPQEWESWQAGQLTLPQWNYEIHDKEMLVIIWAIEE